MKIGICGKMCSGKSTFARLIKEKNNKYVIGSFAGKVYEIAYDLFDMKEKDRQLLQNIGGKMREINPTVWADYIEKKYKDTEFVVIDDVRYKNEVQMLKRNGYYLIKLNISKELQRERLVDLYKDSYTSHLANLNHSSETEFDKLDNNLFDVVIDIDNNKEINSNNINNIIKQIIN